MWKIDLLKQIKLKLLNEKKPDAKIVVSGFFFAHIRAYYII